MRGSSITLVPKVKTNGESWALNDALSKHETRERWMPGAGGLCLHTVLLDPADKQHRAGEAKDGLSKVSQAFTQSEPKATQMAQQTDSRIRAIRHPANLGQSADVTLYKKTGWPFDQPV